MVQRQPRRVAKRKGSDIACASGERQTWTLAHGHRKHRHSGWASANSCRDLPASFWEVRIVTNMRIYWDQILVDTSGGNFPVQLTRLDPTVADLRWRGFSSTLARWTSAIELRLQESLVYFAVESDDRSIHA